jgi:hypothetical protein
MDRKAGNRREVCSLKGRSFVAVGNAHGRRATTDGFDPEGVVLTFDRAGVWCRVIRRPFQGRFGYSGRPLPGAALRWPPATEAQPFRLNDDPCRVGTDS